MRTCLTLVTALAILPATAPSAADGAPAPQVRPRDACAQAAFAGGLARSATVRALSDRLANSDLIVYIECVSSPRGHPRRHLAGSLLWMADAPPARYVLVRLSRLLSPDEMVAVLGHELRHATEVADAAWVRGEGGLSRLFGKLGWRTSVFATFETSAAKAAENAVRLELAAPLSARR